MEEVECQKTQPHRKRSFKSLDIKQTLSLANLDLCFFRLLLRVQSQKAATLTVPAAGKEEC